MWLNSGEAGQLVGGFAHHQVLSLADSIIEAVKGGAIKHFVAMADVMDVIKNVNII